MAEPRAVLFPGQGAQQVGMGQDLAGRFASAREVYARAATVLGVDLAAICFQGPQDALDRTDICQPALLATSVATLAAMEEVLGRPPEADYAAGLSLGEYSALVYAGALSFAEALDLVRFRGLYMQEACDERPGGMASVVGLDLETVGRCVAQARAEGVVDVANVNSPRQVVVSGEARALDAALALCEAAGARRVLRLQVAGAYHSGLMEPAARRLLPHLDAARIREPRVPVVTNVTGDATRDPAAIRDALRRQVSGTVLWSRSLEGLVARGVRRAWEPGPGRVIRGLARQVSKDLEVEPLDTADAVLALAAPATAGEGA